jgi:hypothetical protein
VRLATQGQTLDYLITKYHPSHDVLFSPSTLWNSALKSAVEAKRNDTRAEDKIVYLWDDSYYKRIWKETTFSIDQTQVAEYFPLQPTLRRVLSTLGSNIKEMENEADRIVKSYSIHHGRCRSA